MASSLSAGLLSDGNKAAPSIPERIPKILINGIFKETEPNELTDDLINSNILQIDSTRNTKSQKNISYSALDDDRGEIKIRK